MVEWWMTCTLNSIALFLKRVTFYFVLQVWTKCTWHYNTVKYVSPFHIPVHSILCFVISASRMIYTGDVPFSISKLVYDVPFSISKWSNRRNCVLPPSHQIFYRFIFWRPTYLFTLQNFLKIVNGSHHLPTFFYFSH